MKSYSHVPLIQRLRQATSATVRIRVLYVIIGKGIFKTMNEKKKRSTDLHCFGP